MTSSTDIIVTTGLIAAGVGTLFGLVVHFGSKKTYPSEPRTSTGGRRTRRARRANNGTRRS